MPLLTLSSPSAGLAFAVGGTSLALRLHPKLVHHFRCLDLGEVVDSVVRVLRNQS